MSRIRLSRKAQRREKLLWLPMRILTLTENSLKMALLYPLAGVRGASLFVVDSTAGAHFIYPWLSSSLTRLLSTPSKYP